MNMMKEIRRLKAAHQEQAQEIDQPTWLIDSTAYKMLRVRGSLLRMDLPLVFAPRRRRTFLKRTAPFANGEKKTAKQAGNKKEDALNEDVRKKPRGAPEGHPPWTQEVPEHVDQVVQVDAPEACSCCGEQTDLTRQERTCFVQEDIVLCPRTVVTEYRHGTAGCPGCQ
jgi:hypothetical protein